MGVHTWACTHTHTEACTCACSGGHLDRVCIFRRGFEQRGIQHRIGAKVNSVQASVDRSQEGQHYHPISNARGTSVQSLSHVRLFATPWTAARQASLSITNSRTQAHVHTVGDAIQSSHPLLPPSPPVLNPSQNQGPTRVGRCPVILC